MNLDELSQDIHNIFEKNGWEFEGYGLPIKEDVKVFLETCIQHLESKPIGTVISVQNMSVRKETDKYEVYVHVGSFEMEIEE